MLGKLRKTAAGQFDLLVVADNCNDRTADVARSIGVNVVERNDPSQRGKGFALSFARDYLRNDPPRTVVIMDADCHTDLASLSVLVATCESSQRPAQAVYLMEPSHLDGAVVQLSGFAFLLKNLVRQRGLQRLAGSVHLTGTGMAFPWPLFDRADLATAHIVEDIRLGLELAQAGHHPILVEESRVWSRHADQDATLDQRSRWEGGFLSFARATAPVVFRHAIRTRSLATLMAGMDLLVPPLALLAILNIVALAFATLLAVTGLSSWLLAGVVGTLGLCAGAVLLAAWWREGRPFLSAAALLQLPLYALWKVPMYLKLARSGAPKEWQRTQRSLPRDEASTPPSA